MLILPSGNFWTLFAVERLFMNKSTFHRPRAFVAGRTDSKIFAAEHYSINSHNLL